MASIVVYARVSTEDGQDTASQVRVCRKYAERHGYTVHQIYEDYASAVNFRGRKAWRAMLADLKRWHPRTRPKGVLIYALDRAARSLLDYVTIKEQLRLLDVDLVAADDTLGQIGEEGGPYREMIEGFLALFAQLERRIIVRRTRDGIANAQAKGVQFGRPRREIDWAAWEALPEGLSIRRRAKALGVPPATLQAAERRRTERGVLSGGSEQVGAATPGTGAPNPDGFGAPPDYADNGIESQQISPERAEGGEDEHVRECGASENTFPENRATPPGMRAGRSIP